MGATVVIFVDVKDPSVLELGLPGEALTHLVETFESAGVGRVGWHIGDPGQGLSGVLAEMLQLEVTS